MKCNSCKTTLAGFVILMMASGTGAEVPAEELSFEELKSEVAALRVELAQQSHEIKELRAEKGDTWLNERRAEEVKTLVREVLSDADLRASLQGDALAAGYDGSNFFLASEDRNFMLKFFGQIQVRYVFGMQDETAAADGDEDRGGFEISRLRLGFKGNVIDPTWQYFIWVGTGADQSWLPLDMYITKILGGGWSLQVGQFKVPMWREWLVSEIRQQFIERSLLNAELSGMYTEGVSLDYSGEWLHAILSLNDGLSSKGTTFSTSGIKGGGSATPAVGTEDIEGVAVTGRVELLLSGTWAQAADFEGWQGDEPLLMFGAAAHYQQGEYGTMTDEAQIVRWTLDSSLEIGPFNMLAAVIGSHISDSSTASPSGTGGDLNQIGALIQGGYFVLPDLELIGRYEWGDSDVADEGPLSIVTVGVNKFFDRHRVKLSGDVGYAFRAVSAIWASPSAGWREDADGEDGQIVLRSQLQLLF